jgi:regulator of protease activity HflC (stomatin/prohibitin superfamily)
MTTKHDETTNQMTVALLTAISNDALFEETSIVNRVRDVVASTTNVGGVGVVEAKAEVIQLLTRQSEVRRIRAHAHDLSQVIQRQIAQEAQLEKAEQARQQSVADGAAKSAASTAARELARGIAEAVKAEQVRAEAERQAALTEAALLREAEEAAAARTRQVEALEAKLSNEKTLVIREGLFDLPEGSESLREGFAKAAAEFTQGDTPEHGDQHRLFPSAPLSAPSRVVADDLSESF